MIGNVHYVIFIDNFLIPSIIILFGGVVVFWNKIENISAEDLILDIDELEMMWDKEIFPSLLQKYKVKPDSQIICVEYKYEEMFFIENVELYEYFIWTDTKNLMLYKKGPFTFDVFLAEDQNIALKDIIDKTYIPISIPISNISYFRPEGDIHHETKITGSGGDGGGFDIGGALVGGLVAGGVGAIIGSRKETNPIDIKSEYIEHDERKCVLYYSENGHDKSITFTHDAFDVLKKLIPDKEYMIVEEIKKREIIGESQTHQPQPSTASIPDQIRELSKLKDEGILTEEEFNIKKAELLAKM